MEKKLKKLIKNWEGEMRRAQQNLDLYLLKYDYGNAQKCKTKIVAIEMCVFELKEILNAKK